MKTITFIYRGGVERGTGKPGYAWFDGYSENTADGHPVYPWMTKVECRDLARSRSAKAVFQVPAGRITK